MVEKKPQKQASRYTDKEYSLIKNTFAEQDELLIAIRKVLLQMELTEKQDVLIRGINKENILAVLRKTIFPEVDGDAPLFQIASMWMHTLTTTKEMARDKTEIYIKAREIEVKYMEQQMDVLSGKRPQVKIETSEERNKRLKEEIEYYKEHNTYKEKGESTEGISFAKLKDSDGKKFEQRYVELVAWESLISYIDSQLMQIKLLAGTVEESEEEQLKRITANSSK